MYEMQTPKSSNRPSLKKDSLLVMNLKTQIKEQQRKLSDKENDLYNLRQNIKLTKIDEVEAESKTYYSECLRLRGIIDEYFVNKGLDP